MFKHNQNGSVNGVGISLIIALVLLVGTATFGIWAFMSRIDYKNHSDQKAHAAVVAQQSQDVVVEKAQLAQDQKQPYYTFQGPSQYGGISFQYPKTWSGFVNGLSPSNPGLLDGYFNPGILTSVNDGTAIFALRIKVLNQAYAQTAQAFNAQVGGKKGITAKPYSLPLVPNVVGLEVSGALNVVPAGSTATMIVLPERTYTIEVWTDGTTNLGDFNNTILKNFSFSP